MKKYHIADLLTLCEFILAALLLLGVFCDFSPDLVIWIFVIGELCDAFDGICARKWRYPDDGKRRWWRIHAEFLDKLSDIILLATAAIYIWHLAASPTVFLLTVVLTLVISGFCLVIERVTKDMPAESPTALRLILTRRYLYLVVIAAVIIILIFSTSWPLIFKISSLLVGIVAALCLIKIKLNRLTQNKTPL